MLHRLPPMCVVRLRYLVATVLVQWWHWQWISSWERQEAIVNMIDSLPSLCGRLAMPQILTFWACWLGCSDWANCSDRNDTLGPESNSVWAFIAPLGVSGLTWHIIRNILMLIEVWLMGITIGMDHLAFYLRWIFSTVKIQLTKISWIYKYGRFSQIQS